MSLVEISIFGCCSFSCLCFTFESSPWYISYGDVASYDVLCCCCVGRGGGRGGAGRGGGRGGVGRFPGEPAPDHQRPPGW